jgi:hypothetical protein
MEDSMPIRLVGETTVGETPTGATETVALPGTGKLSANRIGMKDSILNSVLDERRAKAEPWRARDASAKMPKASAETNPMDARNALTDITNEW